MAASTIEFSVNPDAENTQCTILYSGRIIIFGSVARGSATDTSDLDILVVMDSDLKPTRRAREIYTATSDIDLAMDIIVLTPEEFEENRDNPYSFTSEIVRTGAVVYEA